MFVCNFNFSKIASLIQGSTYYLKNCLNQRLLLASRQILYAFTLKVSILNKSKGSNKLNRHFSKNVPLQVQNINSTLLLYSFRNFLLTTKIRLEWSEIYIFFYLFACVKSNIYLVLCRKNIPHKMQKISKSLYISPYGWKSQNICVTNLDL